MAGAASNAWSLAAMRKQCCGLRRFPFSPSGRLAQRNAAKSNRLDEIANDSGSAGTCHGGVHSTVMLHQMLIGASVVIQAAFMLAGLRALERLRTNEREFEHHHATLIIVLFVLFMFFAV